MYFTNVSDIRSEEVHPFLKPRTANTIVRKFNKETSVFAPWKEETTNLRHKAFEIDLQNTKITSVLIKDEEDVSNHISKQS